MKKIELRKGMWLTCDDLMFWAGIGWNEDWPEEKNGGRQKKH